MIVIFEILIDRNVATNKTWQTKWKKREEKPEDKHLFRMVYIQYFSILFREKKKFHCKENLKISTRRRSPILNESTKIQFPQIEDWKRTCLGIIHVASNRIRSLLKQFPDKRRPKGAIGGRRSRKSRWLDSIPRWLAGPFRRGSLTPADARSPSKKPVITEIIEGSRSTRDRDR